MITEKMVFFSDCLWREKYDLTQAEVSSLLGWGAATIVRYEKGSLPTTDQADQLKYIMSDDGLLKSLESKPLSVTVEKMGSLVQKLKHGALRTKSSAGEFLRP